MQEIKKRRIVIASVLKPVDDSRMFEKLGVTLASEFEVWIVGFKGKLHNHNNLFQIPLKHFTRVSFARMLAPWRVLRRIMSIKPHLFVITTHELLIQAVIAKFFLGCTVVYDVQENYYRNILHTNAFPKLLRPIVSLYVRLWERITSPFIDQYLLAEQSYAREIPFMKRKSTVVANKYAGPVAGGRTDQKFASRFLFSGTLSRSTGVFRAVEVVQKLHSIEPTATLNVIGHFSLKSELEEFKKIIARYPFVRLIGGDRLVSHREIIGTINQSDAGIIAYEPSPATEDSQPTKLFEYAANRLPILVFEDSPGVKLVKKWQAGLAIKEDCDPSEVVMRLKNDTFYPHASYDVLWENEGNRLLHLFRRL